jgi:D-psicose/D-tagatose/L-ribulose 3-epimerase
MPIYGAHAYLWGGRIDDEVLLGLLDRCVALGLGFLEVPVGDDTRFAPVALGAAARERGLALVLSPGGEWPMWADLSLTAGDERQRALDWHRRQLATCGACGATAYTGALYGHLGRVLRVPQPETERAAIAEGLHHLAAEAEACGVRIAIEPMSHFRTHVANTPAQVLDLIRRADHSNLSVLFDTYHACTEVGSYREAIEQVLPRLWGLHACENHRGVPGTGILPWGEIGAVLRAHRWTGYIGFESYNSGCDEGRFAISRGMFHNVCPDGDAFVRQAKAFVEGLLRAARG